MSTVDLVQQAFLSDMVDGRIQPGTWVRQDELAERMGVSKIPVREALQRLAAQGLVRFESNRGAVVPELSAEDARENYTLRRAIEVQLLRRALPKMTVVDLAEAEVALAADVSLTTANWHFHRALYQASGWQRGMAMVEILHAAVAPYVVLYTQQLGGGAESDNEHQQLLDACRAGDLAAAEATLVNHLDRATEVLIDFLEARPA